MTERDGKRARLDAVLEAHALDELVLRDPANLAWYLGGARVHVVPLEDAAILEVTVGRAGEELRTSVIESPRLVAEELAPDAPPLRALPWWEPLDARRGRAGARERRAAGGRARRAGRPRRGAVGR